MSDQGTKPKPLEDRLRLIEVSLDVQAEILTSIQESLLEADRLTESIGQLGKGAGALSAALLQVDEQQRRLTELGEELREVKQSSATTKDVDAKVVAAKELVDARQRSFRQKIMLWAGIGVATVALFVYLGMEYMQAASAERAANCERQKRTNEVIVEYLQVVSDNTQTEEIRQAAQDVINSLPVPNEIGFCS